jgi:hypothetical protein
MIVVETFHCHVTEGVVDWGPDDLPTNWKSPEGWITGLQHSSAIELKAMGWLPCRVEIDDEVDREEVKHDGYDFTVSADSVLAEAKAVNLTQDEKDERTRINAL